jgi:hypothetical protein
MTRCKFILFVHSTQLPLQVSTELLTIRDHTSQQQPRLLTCTRFPHVNPNVSRVTDGVSFLSYYHENPLQSTACWPNTNIRNKDMITHTEFLDPSYNI